MRSPRVASVGADAGADAFAGAVAGAAGAAGSAAGGPLGVDVGGAVGVGAVWARTLPPEKAPITLAIEAPSAQCRTDAKGTNRLIAPSFPGGPRDRLTRKRRSYLPLRSDGKSAPIDESSMILIWTSTLWSRGTSTVNRERWVVR